METRARHVIIGLFTLVGFLAALGFGLWLVKSGQQQDTRTYRILFEEAVTGLTVGSQVQYNGLRVGEVRRLQLDPADSRRVLADVEVGADTPINQATRARLAIANITGAANILLSTGNPQAPPLPEADGAPPVILAEPSAIGSLLGNSETLFSNVNVLVERGTQLLSVDNLQRIERIIQNLERVSEELAQSRAGLGETLTELTRAARDAQAVMGDASQLLTRADRMLAARGGPMLADGQHAMRALARTSQQLEQLLERNGGALDQGLQGLSAIGPLMQELQRSLSTLNRILLRLEEDPAGYLTGQPPAHEFTP